MQQIQNWLDELHVDGGIAKKVYIVFAFNLQAKIHVELVRRHFGLIDLEDEPLYLASAAGHEPTVPHEPVWIPLPQLCDRSTSECSESVPVVILQLQDLCLFSRNDYEETVQVCDPLLDQVLQVFTPLFWLQAHLCRPLAGYGLESGLDKFAILIFFVCTPATNEPWTQTIFLLTARTQTPIRDVSRPFEDKRKVVAVMGVGCPNAARITSGVWADAQGPCLEGQTGPFLLVELAVMITHANHDLLR